MLPILLTVLSLHLPPVAISDPTSEVYRAVLRDIGTRYPPSSLVLATAVRECRGAVCNGVAPQGYSREFLRAVREEGLVGDSCTYASGECVKNASGTATGLADVQVTLSSLVPCGSECFDVTSWAIVVENQSLRDVRVLHRVERTAGRWVVTRTTEQGKGFIG